MSWEWTGVKKSVIGYMVTATESESGQTISFDVHRDRFDRDEIVKTLQAKIDALKNRETTEADKLTTLQSVVGISGVG